MQNKKSAVLSVVFSAVFAASALQTAAAQEVKIMDADQVSSAQLTADGWTLIKTSVFKERVPNLYPESACEQIKDLGDSLQADLAVVEKSLVETVEPTHYQPGADDAKNAKSLVPYDVYEVKVSYFKKG